MVAGEVRMYLQDKVEPELDKVETQFKLLSEQNAVAVKKDVLDVLKELNREMFQLVRNVQRNNKTIPEIIPVNIQICWKDLVGLRDEVGRKILSSLSPAEGDAIKIKLLKDLNEIREKLNFVKSMLVSFEREGKKK